MRPDPSVVLVDGPWRHREVSANGHRFHVAEAGQGPLVLLLHGFPEFWWAFHQVLPALAAAGLRAVAVDLRGYGASDKPPRGYDLPTLSADVAGLIPALGEDRAFVVGHGWGALLGWSVAALRPELVSRLAVLAMPHPLLLRRAAFTQPLAQAQASGYIVRFQLPWSAERLLVANSAAYVASLLHRWGGPDFPGPLTERRVREAMLIPGVAHSSLEYYRWAVRSLPRPDGARYAAALRAPVTAPTLQIHGALDGCALPASAVGSSRFVQAPYQWHLLERVGHFPHEEAPDVVTQLLVSWAGG